MFQCNKVILEVPSESFNKGHVTFFTSIGKISLFLFNIDLIHDLETKTKVIKMHDNHYIKSPPLHLVSLSENIFLQYRYIPHHNRKAWSACLVRQCQCQNFKFTGQMYNNQRELSVILNFSFQCMFHDVVEHNNYYCQYVYCQKFQCTMFFCSSSKFQELKEVQLSMLFQIIFLAYKLYFSAYLYNYLHFGKASSICIQSVLKFNHVSPQQVQPTETYHLIPMFVLFWVPLLIIRPVCQMLETVTQQHCRGSMVKDALEGIVQCSL